LGLCYEKGFGVKQDMKEAVKWYRKAARRGDKMAKNHLKKLGISIY
ncbi:MAG: SEL1-like repeat protein, partial [Lentisphaeria bacterium]|nr:SEL1-like repeat protein [Lentisphaeria bacterium]